MNTKIALALLVAALLAGAYFFSDVFSSKVDLAVKQFAEWTPENIAKDPEAYLEFCEQKTEAALEKLNAHDIAIQQSQGRIEKSRQEAQQKIDVGSTALKELKGLYLEAEDSGEWPVQ